MPLSPLWHWNCRDHAVRTISCPSICLRRVFDDELTLTLRTFQLLGGGDLLLLFVLERVSLFPLLLFPLRDAFFFLCTARLHSREAILPLLRAILLLPEGIFLMLRVGFLAVLEALYSRISRASFRRLKAFSRWSKDLSRRVKPSTSFSTCAVSAIASSVPKLGISWTRR